MGGEGGGHGRMPLPKCGEEQKRSTCPQMFYKKMKGLRLDSRSELMFL